MTRFVYFDRSTGDIRGVVSGDLETALANLPSDCECVEGNYRKGRHYWRAGAVQELAGGEADHDRPQAAGSKWGLVRLERDSRMKNFEWRLDRYHRQVRLGLEPTDTLSELDAYMQALADITEQPDPDHIVWPDQP